jgi:hypothetical protein
MGKAVRILPFDSGAFERRMMHPPMHEAMHKEEFELVIGIRLKFARAGHEPRTMRLLGWRPYPVIGFPPRDDSNFARFGASFTPSL